MGISYKDSGVDVEKGDLFVEKIKSMVGETYDDNVISGVGGFACLYKIDEDRYLSAGTDGVGTKLKLAYDLNIHDTIGIDLVAMCANDILCTGARPLFFLDYLSTSDLDLETSQNVLKGIIAGCKEAGLALIGGETAEMPGMYQKGEYDLAGFAVGEVTKDTLIDGSRMKEGLTLIGLPSSGVHSNGFSLLRKLISAKERELATRVLAPTRLYCKQIGKLLKKHGEHICGLSHVTGGGLMNIPRMNKDLDYTINSWPTSGENWELFTTLRDRSKNDWPEMFKTFNMGIGLVIACEEGNVILDELKSLGENPIVLGETKSGSGKVSFNSGEINFEI